MLLLHLTRCLSFVYVTSCSLISSPTDTVVTAASVAQLRCSSSMTSQTIHWSFRPADKRSLRERIYHGAGSKLKERLRINTTTPGQSDLIIISAQLSDAGQYECKDDDGFGESASAQLVVLKSNPVCHASLHNLTEEFYDNFGKIDVSIKDNATHYCDYKHLYIHSTREASVLDTQVTVNSYDRNARTILGNTKVETKTNAREDIRDISTVDSDQEADINMELFDVVHSAKSLMVIRLTCIFNYSGEQSLDIKWSSDDIRQPMMTNSEDIVDEIVAEASPGEFSATATVAYSITIDKDTILKLSSSLGAKKLNSLSSAKLRNVTREEFDLLSMYSRTCTIGFHHTVLNFDGSRNVSDSVSNYSAGFVWSSTDDVRMIFVNYSSRVAAKIRRVQLMLMNCTEIRDSDDRIEVSVYYKRNLFITSSIVVVTVVVLLCFGFLLCACRRGILCNCRCHDEQQDKQVGSAIRTESAAYNLKMDASDAQHQQSTQLLNWTLTDVLDDAAYLRHRDSTSERFNCNNHHDLDQISFSLEIATNRTSTGTAAIFHDYLGILDSQTGAREQDEYEVIGLRDLRMNSRQDDDDALLDDEISCKTATCVASCFRGPITGIGVRAGDATRTAFNNGGDSCEEEDACCSGGREGATVDVVSSGVTRKLDDCDARGAHSTTSPLVHTGEAIRTAARANGAAVAAGVNELYREPGPDTIKPHFDKKDDELRVENQIKFGCSLPGVQPRLISNSEYLDVAQFLSNSHLV